MSVPEIVTPLKVVFDIQLPAVRKARTNIPATLRWKVLFDVVGRLAKQASDESPSSWAGLLFADFETAYRASMAASSDLRWRLNRLMRSSGQEREIQTRLAEQSDGWLLCIRVTPADWAEQERAQKRRDEEESRLGRKWSSRRSTSQDELLAAFGIDGEIPGGGNAS